MAKKKTKKKVAKKKNEIVERLQQNDRGEEYESKHLTICFDGLEAHSGQMPLDDFLKSLAGWRDFFELSSSIYLQSKLTLNPLSKKEGLQIKIQRVKQGSLSATFLVAVVGSAVGGLFAIKADKIITIENTSKLWRWIQTHYEFHVEKKKSLQTKDEIAKDLELLAEEHDIKVERKWPESQRIVSEIDTHLKAATFPIEKSVGTITLKNNDMNISVDIMDRRAIKTGFLVNDSIDEHFKALVYVRELNLDTGHIRLEIIHSQNEEFVSRLDKCYIEDDYLRDPGNRYSQALDKQEAIGIYVSQSVDLAGETLRWRIKLEIPNEENPLLDL